MTLSNSLQAGGPHSITHRKCDLYRTSHYIDCDQHKHPYSLELRVIVIAQEWKLRALDMFV